jgi:hypothetical protein
VFGAKSVRMFQLTTPRDFTAEYAKIGTLTLKSLPLNMFLVVPLNIYLVDLELDLGLDLYHDLDLDLDPTLRRPCVK